MNSIYCCDRELRANCFINVLSSLFFQKSLLALDSRIYENEQKLDFPRTSLFLSYIVSHRALQFTRTIIGISG